MLLLMNIPKKRGAMKSAFQKEGKDAPQIRSWIV